MPTHVDYTHQYSGHSFNLERSALYLISIILADKELKNVYRKYSLPHLETWIEEKKEEEIIRLMVEIATCYRLMDWNAKRTPNSDVVGALEMVADSNQWADLTMLEACNKVIHATEIAFDVQKIRNSQVRHFNPVIHFSGTKGRKKWNASIDLLLFCNGAVHPIDSPF